MQVRFCESFCVVVAFSPRLLLSSPRCAPSQHPCLFAESSARACVPNDIYLDASSSSSLSSSTSSTVARRRAAAPVALLTGRYNDNQRMLGFLTLYLFRS
jgi:hypothetical protein